LQTTIEEESAAPLGRYASDIPTIASWTVTTDLIYNAAKKNS
jgi:hypothetical protein